MNSSKFLGHISLLICMVFAIHVSTVDNANPKEVLKDVKVIAILEDVNSSLKCLFDSFENHSNISTVTINGVAKIADEVLQIKNSVTGHKTSIHTLESNMKRLIKDAVLDVKSELSYFKAYTNTTKVEELNAKILKLEREIEDRKAEVMELENLLEAERKSRKHSMKTKCPFLTQKETLLLEQELTSEVQRYNQAKNWRQLKRTLEKVLDHDSAAYKQLQNISDDSSNPLFQIGRDGKEELAEVLVNHGHAVNAADKHGTTILYGAAYSGDVNMAVWLLDQGADIEAGFTGGRTPLMNAAERGHLQLVKFLVRAGASTTATNEDGFTALDCARNSGQENVAKFLSELL